MAMHNVLVIDNYDSFTYNLVHLIEKVSGHRPVVKLNNHILPEEADAFDKILFSPGPGLPSQAGVMPAMLQRYHTQKSILGVCLGMQAIGELFQSPLRNLPQVCHGKSTPIFIKEQSHLFAHCPTTFHVGRYHSWVVDESTLHPDLMVTATDEQGQIMALRHKHFDVQGVQFHPESILSEYGETILKNWIHPSSPKIK